MNCKLTTTQSEAIARKALRNIIYEQPSPHHLSLYPQQQLADTGPPQNSLLANQPKPPKPSSLCRAHRHPSKHSFTEAPSTKPHARTLSSPFWKNTLPWSTPATTPVPPPAGTLKKPPSLTKTRPSTLMVQRYGNGWAARCLEVLRK